MSYSLSSTGNGVEVLANGQYYSFDNRLKAEQAMNAIRDEQWGITSIRDNSAFYGLTREAQLTNAELGELATGIGQELKEQGWTVPSGNLTGN